ncbi:hypothetical protein T8A63_19325 (plasmid) [Sulfitobacter sp. OXR-159]|uniref:hypothetical protein n=1 Tax=Sulfitobacter sp. OXR-159 TaxID=3100174 RepID=UPI002AC94C1A|nr:hypothetical protein [Sulfitobacter sp. OXR-159]WPZ31659.1 hypothetical protein T8A63_19325 [Sulfitobacter sp. OXR-159]
MSDIIRFPQPATSSSLTAFGLTKADDACSSLDMAELYDRIHEENTVDLGQDAPEANVSFFPQRQNTCTPASGWTNQELADLYRTQRILALAGVTTQVDHGITDEGDPWFVFMDGQNEVLVHFSRFDGFYLVTSQLQEEPIKGDSLHDLVSEFSRRVQPVAQAGQNVVSLARNNQGVAFIHPAAALAALVWSVYLMADELIAATPAVTEDAPGDMVPPLNDEFVAHTVPQEELSALTPKVSPSPSIREAAKTSLHSSSNREVAVGLSGHGAKVAGVSLSLVALAVGLPLPAGSVLETASDDASIQKVSLDSLSAALVDVKSKEAALLVASETVKLQQRELASSDLVSDEVKPAAPNIDPEAEAPTKIKVLAEAQVEQIAKVSYVKPEPTSEPDLRNAEVVQSEESSDVSEEIPAKTSGILQAESLEEVSFFQSFDEDFESFEISSLDKIAKNELDQLLDTGEAKVSSAPVSSIDNRQGYGAFDLKATEFLDFLLHTYDDIKVVNLDTEIIFIHMGAFEEGSDTYEVYAKSWSFDDGGVISTIGFKSDMAQFDLIA